MLQKITLRIAVACLTLYGGYTAYRSGGIDQLFYTFRTIRSSFSSPTPGPAAVSVIPTVSVRPRPVPTALAGEYAEVLAEINADRSAAGKPPVRPNAFLQREAQSHADDMVAKGYFDHTTPEGVTFQQRMAASGYPTGTAAENLALTTTGNISAMVTSWMGSPPHRINLLGAYTEVGIGIARGSYEGRADICVVAIFGHSK